MTIDDKGECTDSDDDSAISDIDTDTAIHTNFDADFDATNDNAITDSSELGHFTGYDLPCYLFL